MYTLNSSRHVSTGSFAKVSHGQAITDERVAMEAEAVFWAQELARHAGQTVQFDVEFTYSHAVAVGPEGSVESTVIGMKATVRG